ncbi:MAG: fumarylacetoacetate hydrolase family protein [Propionibacteriaceae bacterium]|nr:fumarylacetoacetate hydrolase family protein [Micropruina sp.]HBX81117.1 2-hydroxyhepta-2,4-diene-1,7-dioate isomerase [Propionibacteriaceae bacterium]HBY24211.1 2-hydroxyhepta-2,4-diene-1,7-dioate isomerase [Propionibacteriaceae bacterium]
MRLARFVAGGDPKYGLVELASDNGDHPDTIATLAGDPFAGRVSLTGERHPLDDVRLVAPVLPRSKVIGIGRNYAAHAKELGNDLPTEPVTFLKPNTSVIGPGEPIVHPVQTHDLQHEGELAVVIGRICRHVPVDKAEDVIFGYTVANDVTARDLQHSDAQWTRAKSFDTFCPLGPWIITHLRITEVGGLDLAVTVNGETRQHGNTSDMVFGVAELVAYVSSFMTLLPGDVILTGTPSGVSRMYPGDRVEVTIAEIGTLANIVVAEEADDNAGAEGA